SMFERLEVFVRGDSIQERTRRPWWKLFREERRKVPCYQRLVVMLDLRDHPRLEKNIARDAVYLKVFKDVPKPDLDMLLPGARVRMSKIDKALIISPMLSGVGLLAWNATDSILKTGVIVGMAGLATWGAAGALGGYGYKSWYSYQVKKQEYTLQ